MVKIVNIVASGDLGREYDLVELSKDLDIPHIQYEPENFPGLQVRFEKGGPVLSLFSSGKYTITGVETQSELESVYTNVLNTIQKLDSDDVSRESPVIRNLVCKGDLGREIDLPSISLALGMEDTEYEPEQSSFVYYWPEKVDCLITIPSNGQVIITGIVQKKDAERAFSHLQTRIESLFSG
jgi:transcription initiation factor TFIID TATA-box-binding protein